MNKERAKRLLIKVWPFIAILAAIYLIMMVQKLNGYTVMSSDTWFHYSRFYEASEQIRHRTFSYFQMNYSFDQSGRVINAVYGPIFSYLMGFILLVVGSWYRFQLFSYVLIGLVAGCGMYALNRKLRVGQLPATIFSIFYLYIGPLQSWFDHTNMTAWGGALAPIVLLEGVNMIMDHQKPVRWVRLAVVMSIVAQVHLLSTVILGLALVPFAILGLVKAENRPKMLLDGVKAILLTLVLSANIWVALLIQMHVNHLVPTTSFDLAENGLYKSTVGTVRRGVLPLMKLLLLLLALQWVVSLLQRKNWLNNFITGYGFVALFMCTAYFPWAKLQMKWPFLGSNFQFPYRLTIVAYPLLMAGMALSAQRLAERKETIAYRTWIGMALFVLMASYGVNYGRMLSYTSHNFIVVEYYPKHSKHSLWNYTLPKNYRGKGVKRFKKAKIRARVVAKGFYSKNCTQVESFEWEMQQRNMRWKLFKRLYKRYPDYLPDYSSEGLTPKAGVETVTKEVHHRRVKGHYHYQPQRDGSLKLTWTSKHSGLKQLPLIVYKNSQLTVNGKVFSHKKSRLSKIGAPSVEAKPGKNTAVLKYRVPASFKVMSLAAVIGWLVVAIGFCKRNWRQGINKLKNFMGA